MATQAAADMNERAGSGGRYVLEQELARGGMGIVYRALDTLAGRAVAYKRLHVAQKSSYATCAALFEREYNVLAQLRHPNIVQVHDYGIDAVGPYYTMELLTGGDLFAAAPLELKRACAVLRDVASALALVHARRFVHRDVTPANVRLAADGGARLIDFGALTPFGRAREIVGTPQFVAPECLAGAELDARADLFALGALAYWTLTRRAPIGARTLQERMEQPNPLLVPPSQHVMAIPKELDDLVLSLLHADPLARPASAAEVMQRLTDIADLPRAANEQLVAFSYLAHPPLVGRTREMTQVNELLQQSALGAQRTLIVQGAPGLGRSALLDHIAIVAQVKGATVLRAQGGAQRAFALAEELLRAGGSSFDAAERTPRDPPAAGAGATGAEQGASPVAVAVRHARRVDELQSALLAVCQQQRVAILIDDAERADKESLAVLAALSRSAHAMQLLLVLSTTEGQLVRGSALGILAQSAQVAVLPPLQAADVAELVTAVFGGVANTRRLSLWLEEHGGGNPALCMALLRRLLSDGALQYDNGTFILPYDVSAQVTIETADVVSRGIASLNEDAREIAERLSLQQDRLPIEVLIVASEWENARVLSALTELAAAALVHGRDGEVWIASDRLRTALDSQVDEPTRKSWHLRLGRALLARGFNEGGKGLVTAAHLLRGGDEQQGTALIAQVRQGVEVAVSGATAMPLLEQVLAMWRQRGMPDEHCLPLLSPLSDMSYFGDYRKQCEHGDRGRGAMLTLSGVRLAKRLSAWLPAKIAFVLGVIYALIRRRFIPLRYRFGSSRETFQRLAVSLSGSTAGAVSAFDVKKAFEIIDSASPMASLPVNHALRVGYEFSRGTAEVGAGQNRQAAARYAKLIEVLDQGGVQGMDAQSALVVRWGALHGQAQAELSKGSPLTLTLADQLRKGHPFYVATAESICMAYHALRGEQELADKHRELAELAALRNGMSWSSVTLLTVRSAYAYMLSRNVMGLLQSVSELTRLGEMTPNLLLFRDAARAYGSLLSGRLETALALYEQLLRDPRHAWLPTAWINRTHYAEVLNALGRHAEAKHVCTAILEDSHALLEGDQRRNLPVQQLALAQAKHGDLSSAKALLDGCLQTVQEGDSPLLVGSLHRDRALLAVWERDEDGLAAHLLAMSEQYRSTRNPWLIRQCEQLAADAQSAGLLVRLTLERAEVANDVFETGHIDGDAFESAPRGTTTATHDSKTEQLSTTTALA